MSQESSRSWRVDIRGGWIAIRVQCAESVGRPVSVCGNFPRMVAVTHIPRRGYDDLRRVVRAASACRGEEWTSDDLIRGAYETESTGSAEHCPSTRSLLWNTFSWAHWNAIRRGDALRYHLTVQTELPYLARMDFTTTHNQVVSGV